MILTIPYPSGTIIIPIQDATMQQAIDWMNLSPSFPERLERRFILKQYIGTHCNLRLRVTNSPDSSPNKAEESNSPEGG